MDSFLYHEIKRQREYLGLTVDEVSKALKIEKGQLASIENGVFEPTQQLSEILLSFYKLRPNNFSHERSHSLAKFLARSKTEDLSIRDIDEIQRFANFLMQSPIRGE